MLIWRMCEFTSKKSPFPPGGPHCSFSPPNILLCSASTPPGASRRAVVAWLYERGAREQFYGFSVNFTGAVGAGAGAPTPRQKRNLRIFFRAPLSLQCHRRPFDLPCAVWAPHRASNLAFGVRARLRVREVRTRRRPLDPVVVRAVGR